ncbi:MAG: PAS domain S-box protein, partial [Candidatus Marinimicrobia bacterium]|nr:PAS domain S-box protein [Candidatus Neomarinimicrobiota bacterium]
MSKLFQNNRSRTFTAILWVVVPVCVIFLLVLIVDARLRSEIEADRRIELQKLVNGHAELIEHTIHKYEHYLNSVRSFVLSEVADEHMFSEAHFSLYAENIFDNISAFKAIILSPSGIHQYAYPPEMNQKVLGYDLLFDPREEVQNDITKILESDQTICSGPYPMVNDSGTVFTLRHSIFHQNKLWGIASLIIDFQEFIRSTDILTSSDLEFGLRETDTGEMLIGSPSIWDTAAVSQTIRFADARWQLAGVPRGGWSQNGSGMRLRFWFSGIIIMTLTGLLSYRTFQNRYELNDMVGERTEQLQEALRHQEKLREEQERTSRALEKSEERYRRFVHQISEGVYRIEFSKPIQIDLPEEEVVDALYDYAVIAECNNTFAKMIGFPDERAVLGKKLEELQNGRQKRETRERLRDLIESNYQVKEQLSTVTDLDGNLRYYLNSVVGIIEEGYLLRSWGTQVDITDRYLAEQSLQKSQEQLSLAIEGADLGLWDWNIETGVVVFNDRWYSMLGYDSSEVESHVSSWEKLIHPEDYQDTLDTLQTHLDGDSDYYESVHRLKTKSGEYKWVLDSGKIVEWNDEGEPLRAAGIHQDINEMKQAEIALRKSDEQYRQIFENAPVGIFLSTSGGRFLNVNNATVELLGYNSRGHLLSNVVNLGAQVYMDSERRDQFLEELKQHNEVTNFELRARKRDGEQIWLSLDAKIQQWESEKDFLIFGFISDKTEQKKIENALQKSEQQYRLLADTAQEMIVMHTLDGAVEYVNPAVERLTGYSPEEAYQKDISLFLPDNALNEIRERNRTRRSGKDDKILYNIEIETKDGNTLPVEASSTPVMNDGE